MKKILLIFISIFLLCQNVFADNLGDAITAWKNLVSTVKGITYSAINSSLPIKDVEQWKALMNEAINNQADTLSVTIVNFDQNVYDITTFRSYDVAISAKGSVTGTIANITYSFSYHSNYRMTRAYETGSKDKLNVEELSVYDKLVTKAQEIKSQYTSDFDKEKAIHDYIVTTFKYGPLDVETPPLRAHTIVGLINDGEGVCEAYAQTFNILGKMCGLDVQCITGKMEGVSHMWNIIKLDGEYYHVDVTSDDPTPDDGNRLIYSNFNLTDEQISEKHTWDTSQFPKCTATKYNYYDYYGLVATNYSELQNIINSALSKGQKTITFETRNYILNSSNDIKSLFQGKGFSSIYITGDFGEVGAFSITVS